MSTKYPYGQEPLDESTAKHCNFQIYRRKMNRYIPIRNRTLRTVSNADRNSEINGHNSCKYGLYICVL